MKLNLTFENQDIERLKLAMTLACENAKTLEDATWFNSKYELIVGLQRQESRRCPKCQAITGESDWTHPECPTCHHHNAIISGTCRDCRTQHPKLKNKFERYCNACGHRFLV